MAEKTNTSHFRHCYMRFIAAATAMGNLPVSDLRISLDTKGRKSMTDKFWEKLGRFFGHVIAVTLVVCAWLLIVVFTLKLIWFILFRILL
jgi:hypothetical protein